MKKIMKTKFNKTYKIQSNKNLNNKILKKGKKIL